MTMASKTRPVGVDRDGRWHPLYVAVMPFGVVVRTHARGIRVHHPDACEGRACIVHHPSGHHMVNWPVIYRSDRDPSFSERLCEHGAGHPDPDDMAWLKASQDEYGTAGTHGCDGCCRAPMAEGTAAVIT